MTLDSRERGIALPVALIVAVAVGGIVLAIAERSRSLATQSVHAVAGAQARQAAESGLELAQRRLRDDAAYRGERIEVGVCDVAIVVEAAGAGFVVRAHATGRHGEDHAVELEFLRTAEGLAAGSWRVAPRVSGR